MNLQNDNMMRNKLERMMHDMQGGSEISLLACTEHPQVTNSNLNQTGLKVGVLVYRTPTPPHRNVLDTQASIWQPKSTARQ